MKPLPYYAFKYESFQKKSWGLIYIVYVPVLFAEPGKDGSQVLVCVLTVYNIPKVAVLMTLTMVAVTKVTISKKRSMDH